MQVHPYVLMNCLCAIDEEIAPLVKWLNSMPHTRVCYSCQGSDEPRDSMGSNVRSRAYLTFVCENEQMYQVIVDRMGMPDLRRIRKRGKHNIISERDTGLGQFGGKGEYMAQWENKAKLKRTIARVLGTSRPRKRKTEKKAA